MGLAISARARRRSTALLGTSDSTLPPCPQNAPNSRLRSCSQARAEQWPSWSMVGRSICFYAIIRVREAIILLIEVARPEPPTPVREPHLRPRDRPAVAAEPSPELAPGETSIGYDPRSAGAPGDGAKHSRSAQDHALNPSSGMRFVSNSCLSPRSQRSTSEAVTDSLPWRNAHSQTTATRHPALTRSRRFRSSLATFSTNFDCQNFARVAGVVAYRQRPCLCQKQP